MDSKSSETNETLPSGEFIDDYSHLRFSYYRDVSLNSSFAINSSALSNDTLETDVSESNIKKAKPQLPDLPHPSYVMASIISSASNRMNTGNMQFKYANRVETAKTQPAQFKFSPSRRSTLLPEKNNNKLE
ncbi:uncharacterized protein LOC123689262 [Pieris rapae]|uniref:uncharacterized protein LOC123689262 n=1 Tax=Pieris rapae TaxID=64459 RepID=UPI001E27CEF6|nr:uncharacterized protein LOC123689262 [Pieris rapae]